MIRTYLDWLISVPWSKRSEERLDPAAHREVLDADHAGLEDVKDRIVEYVAVRKLREERGIEADKKRSGAILTLIGPPGTGKTSIGESIARAMGREFVRMSLGGVRDEAEIRGHRRTYIGALPGRLVRALRDAGTMNPVILLDEVDKVGADWRGDPQRGAARGARPGAELDVPRPLPGRGARPVARSCSSPPPTRPRRSPARCWTAWRSSASTATPSPRRSRSPATTCGRASASATACARTRSRSPTTCSQPSSREYTREAGVRQLERELGTLLRKTATRIASGDGEAPVDDRRRARPRRARPPEGVPGGGDAHGGAGRGDRPGGHRHRRRRAVRRGHLDERRRARPDAHRPARRRHEGVGADRADLRARATPTSSGIDPRRLRGPRVPRPRPRGRDPEGRAERRHHDDDGARVAADRAARSSTRSA